MENLYLKIKGEMPPMKIEKITTGSIYHYTPISGMQGIVTSRSFWVTRSDFLNDRLEINYFTDIAKNVCNKVLMGHDNFKHEILRMFSDDYRKAFVRSNYVLSFSLNPDSLPLWNYYAKDDGYNLSFEFEKLFGRTIFDYAAHHGKVIYNKEEQLEILESELKFAYEFWVKNGEHESNILDVTDEINGRWLIYSLFFKHPSFRPEEEYRFVFNNNWINQPIHFRPRHGVMIPYITQECLDRQGNFPLVAVTIGPKITQDNAHDGIYEWLISLGFDMKNKIKILRSDIPLRF